MIKKLGCALILACLIITGCTMSSPPPAETPPTEIPPADSAQPNPPSDDNHGASDQQPEALDTFLIKKGAALTENIPYRDIESVAVLVNKQNALPTDYVPPDLVEVNIPFTFKEKSEKRMMRKEAAQHLEELFAHAKDEGFILYGISGYRSYTTQKGLFAYNVRRFGSEKDANQISARAGESEHQTGLAMDISSQSVNFGLVQTFGETVEYDWLKDHAHEYGFIIRYLKGKEFMTEYMYEPWHLRYVGVDLATKLYESKLTYEEYLFFKI